MDTAQSPPPHLTPDPTPKRTGRWRMLRWGALFLLALAAVAAYTWAFRQVYTLRAPGANDFLPRWAGARVALTRGWDPYGPEASLYIQEIIYGQAAQPGQDPSLFAYPYYTIFLVAPYALLPYDWAQPAWQVTLQVMVGVTLFLLLRYFGWRPRPLALGGLALWMITFYPTARSIILGQISLVVLLLTILALWLLFRSQQPCPRCDLWAGFLLAVTTVKPQMQFLIIPFLLLWAARERRWRLIVGFGGALALLLGLSFLLLPTWLGEWLGQVCLYPSYTPPSVLFILTHEVLSLGQAAGAVERLLDVALVAYLLWEWWLTLGRRTAHRLDWTLGLTLVITHLVAPRTATTHFVVFTFALIPLFHSLIRHGPVGAGAAVLLMLGMSVGMWVLFVATLVGVQEANLVHVPLPLLVLGLTAIVRPTHLLPTPSADLP